MINTMYKVVAVEQGTGRMISTIQHGPSVVEYFMNKRAVPVAKKTPLFGFSKLTSAFGYWPAPIVNGGALILECTYRPYHYEVPNYRLSFSAVTTVSANYLSKMWLELVGESMIDLTYGRKSPMLENVVLATSVVPFRVVGSWEISEVVGQGLFEAYRKVPLPNE